MPRPKRIRRIMARPRVETFGPESTQAKGEIILSLEEFEAVRLIDYDGMDQSQVTRADGAVDTVITNALILDHWGIVKADIGIKDGRIAAIGKAGNPDVQPGVNIVIGPGTEAIAGEGQILTAGGIDAHIHFICPQQVEEALNGLEDIERITSDVRDGLAVVQVEFEFSADADEKYDEVVQQIVIAGRLRGGHAVGREAEESVSVPARVGRDDRAGDAVVSHGDARLTQIGTVDDHDAPLRGRGHRGRRTGLGRGHPGHRAERASGPRDDVRGVDVAGGVEDGVVGTSNGGQIVNGNRRQRGRRYPRRDGHRHLWRQRQPHPLD